MYPAIVSVFATLMAAGLLIFIVPIFVRMFAQFGGELPLPTRILAAVSRHMLWAAPLAVVLGMVATTTARKVLREKPRARLAFDRFKLRLPIFGSIILKVAVSRFTRNLSALLAAGVPAMTALDVVAATTGNAVIAGVLGEVREAVRDGKPMSAPLRDSQVLPAMVTQMMQAGEESGQISQMLAKVAESYDREVDAAAESLTATIEPIMVVVMGSVVGLMVICLYLPMFTIFQKIQGTD
ncbi:type II secretion system F family protein [Luedemannella flava]